MSFSSSPTPNSTARLSLEMRTQAEVAVASLHGLRATITRELDDSMASHCPAGFAPLNHEAFIARARGIRRVQDAADCQVQAVIQRRNSAVSSLRYERRAAAKGEALVSFVLEWWERRNARSAIAEAEKRRDRAIRSIEDAMEKYVRHRDVSLHSRQFLYAVSV